MGEIFTDATLNPPDAFRPLLTGCVYRQQFRGPKGRTVFVSVRCADEEVAAREVRRIAGEVFRGFRAFGDLERV
jgi:hypothetical protein